MMINKIFYLLNTKHISAVVKLTLILVGFNQLAQVYKDGMAVDGVMSSKAAALKVVSKFGCGLTAMLIEFFKHLLLVVIIKLKLKELTQMVVMELIVGNMRLI